MRNALKEIDVILLCGGKGTRLKEETDTRPKPMVDIGGRPILWHIMKYYSSFGFRRFILALGYKADVIKKFFYDYRLISSNFTIHLNPKIEPNIHSVSDECDWEIVCVDTGLHTLKGGRIKRLESFIRSERFHLTYGDGLSDVDLYRLDHFHRNHGKTGTVTAVHPPSRFGEMTIDGDFVTEFLEKPQLQSGYINGGFFVFNSSFLNVLTTDEACDLEFGALQKLSRDRQLATYKHDGYWQCMDTLRDRQYLEKLWNDKHPPWKNWP